MLLIECPWCGPRDEHEFHCGGQSHIQRPGPAESVSDAQWAGYLFDRLNPRGAHAERWVHQYGCGRWFNMVRDTTTHQILAIYQMHEPCPVPSDKGAGL
jgi:sarcosine oxidase, delta subunit family, heterotetrameric form